MNNIWHDRWGFHIRLAAANQFGKTRVAPAQVADVNPEYVHRWERWVFACALALRLLVVLLVFCLFPDIDQLSPDSSIYHVHGQTIAAQYASGNIDWSRWIDDGWRQFVGLVYAALDAKVQVIQVFNALLASVAAVLVFRLALLATGDLTAACFSGFGFACFPSVVYYTSMPLKEAAAVFALISICYGTIHVINGAHRGWLWMMLGFVVLVSLRLYLVVPCLLGMALCFLFAILTAYSPLGQGQSLALSVGVLAIVVLGAFIGSFEFSKHRMTYYFDLDRLNAVRVSLADGRTPLTDAARAGRFNGQVLSDAAKVTRGVYAFLFSIEIWKAERPRHYAALLESAVVLLALPFCIAGIVVGWHRRPQFILPVVVIGLTLMVVYVAATTNVGAMFRWRMQSIPFFLILAAYGLSVWLQKNRANLTGVGE